MPTEPITVFVRPVARAGQAAAAAALPPVTVDGYPAAEGGQVPDRYTLFTAGVGGLMGLGGAPPLGALLSLVVAESIGWLAYRFAPAVFPPRAPPRLPKSALDVGVGMLAWWAFYHPDGLERDRAATAAARARTVAAPAPAGLPRGAASAARASGTG